MLANLKGNDTDNLTILVPLCGKAVEISYFTTVLSSSKVVGVDGVQQAIDEFISENKSLGLADMIYKNVIGEDLDMSKIKKELQSETVSEIKIKTKNDSIVNIFKP